jgi:hypothetical protein
MTKINENELQTIIKEIEGQIKSFEGKGKLTGYTYNKIVSDGEYNEAGITLTKADIPLFQYYAGLTVLVRDMQEYLKQYLRHDSELFEEFVYTTITEENKKIK